MPALVSTSDGTFHLRCRIPVCQRWSLRATAPSIFAVVSPYPYPGIRQIRMPSTGPMGVAVRGGAAVRGEYGYCRDGICEWQHPRGRMSRIPSTGPSAWIWRAEGTRSQPPGQSFAWPARRGFAEESDEWERAQHGERSCPATHLDHAPLAEGQRSIVGEEHFVCRTKALHAQALPVYFDPRLCATRARCRRLEKALSIAQRLPYRVGRHTVAHLL